MFKGTIARNASKGAVSIEFFTKTPDTIESGKYWVGPLEAIFPLGFGMTFPISEMVHDVIQQQVADGTDLKGVLYTHKNFELPFLLAPVNTTNFECSTGHNPVVLRYGSLSFDVTDWLILMPVSEVIASSPRQEYDLLCSGVIAIVQEPVKPVLSLNRVELVRTDPDTVTGGSGTEIVFAVTAQ